MDEDVPPEVPKSLRWLMRLVTVLTVVMIVGILAVIGLLFAKLRSSPPPAPMLPAQIALPEGTVPQAITAGNGWYAVVTTEGRILIFDAAGKLTQEVAITPGG